MTNTNDAQLPESPYGCALALVIGVVAICLFWYACSYDSRHGMGSAAPGPVVPNSSTKPLAGSTRVTRAGYVACESEDAIKRAVELANENDRAAFGRYVTDPSNGCAVLKGGQQVVVEDVTFGGYIKIRPVGEPSTVWVLRDAVQ